MRVCSESNSLSVDTQFRPSRGQPVRLAATITSRARLDLRDPREDEEETMSRRARKRRDRKKGGANHGKRPNT
jgi:hypothetical protein